MQTLQTTEGEKDLGVVVDPDLNFEKHIVEKVTPGLQNSRSKNRLFLVTSQIGWRKTAKSMSMCICDLILKLHKLLY